MKKSTIESILFVIVIIGAIVLCLGFYFVNDFLFVAGGSVCLLFLIPLILSVLNQENDSNRN